MALRWAASARADLVRIHDFLEPVHSRAAAFAVRQVVAGVKRIPAHPRLGNRLPGFGHREVRRLLVGAYELRYAVMGKDIVALRIFHTREDR